MCQPSVLTLSAFIVCDSIQALLSAPNPDDPLADNVAKEWKENEQLAVRTGIDSFSHTFHMF